MSKLKNNDELKLQLVQLVKGKGLSIAEAARQLDIKVRTAQYFFDKKQAWAKEWWEDNQSGIDDYFKGLYKENPLLMEIPYEIDNDQIHPNDINKKVDWFKGLWQEDKKYDNSRILLISDLHIPYHHPDALDFLQYLKDKYNPTRVICLGDEVDHLALSYHEKETDAPSAVDELKMALPIIKELEQMFPVMDILDSNHGSLAYRKAKTAGIPKHYLKSYADVLQVGGGWTWHFDLVIDLPRGNSCYLHHGKSANVTKTSQAMSMCAVQGHYHNTFKVEYWANPKGLYWGMQCGCLIDDKSFAFNYNNVNLHRPLIGTGLIIDGLPVLEAMVLDCQGRWIQREAI